MNSKFLVAAALFAVGLSMSALASADDVLKSTVAPTNKSGGETVGVGTASMPTGFVYTADEKAARSALSM